MENPNARHGTVQQHCVWKLGHIYWRLKFTGELLLVPAVAHWHQLSGCWNPSMCGPLCLLHCRPSPAKQHSSSSLNQQQAAGSSESWQLIWSSSGSSSDQSTPNPQDNIELGELCWLHEFSPQNLRFNSWHSGPEVGNQAQHYDRVIVCHDASLASRLSFSQAMTSPVAASLQQVHNS